MAVEFHDALYHDKEDLYDQVSGVKMVGEVDHDKIESYKNVLSNVL